MFTELDVTGRARRGFGHHHGGGGGGLPPGCLKLDEPTGAESFVGLDPTSGDEVWDVEVDEYAFLPDATGSASGRKKHLQRVIKRIRRARERAHAQWERHDARLLGRERAAEIGAGVRHVPEPWELQDPRAAAAAMACAAKASQEVARPLAASAAVGAGATGTVTVTPQYPMTIDRFIMSATISLPSVLVTSLMLGVDNVPGNTEFGTGWGADVFAQNSTIGLNMMKGRRVPAQMPIKVGVLNTNAAGQTVSLVVTADTTVGASVG